jgi:Cu/Ag efflux pump CusA
MVAIFGMAVLLFAAFRSVRDVALVMLNVSLALVGFITLFGIAARNGIMMITHYRHLLATQGVTMREAVIQGASTAWCRSSRQRDSSPDGGRDLGRARKRYAF